VEVFCQKRNQLLLLESKNMTLHAIENFALYLLIIPATTYVQSQVSNQNFCMSLLKQPLEH
jgi:hypothetical protein